MHSMLILRDDQQKITDIELFLKSREFKVTVTDSPQEAIRFITERRPDYALLSIDLLPKNCSWLLGILGRLTIVIPFFEKVSAKTLSITRDLPGLQILEPPLTPLGMNQVLRKIQREQEAQFELTSNLDRTHLWVMSALAELSMKAVCIPGAVSGSVEPVQRASRLTCFRLDSLKFSGHLVFAYGKDRQVDSAWAEQLRAEIKERLKDFMGPLVLDSAEEIQVKEVKFREWTKAESDFILQAIHQNTELVMAFFKDQVKIETKPSSQPGHIEMLLRDFPEEQVLDFDVYIYLPQNARFILHTSKGNSLSASKKKKLMDDGIETVHIPKRSLDQVIRYQARKHLEQTAQSHY